MTALTPHDWQQDDIDGFFEGEHKSWLMAYEMSLGKTLVAVETAKRIGVNTAVIVLPLNTRRSWEKTFASQWPDMPVYRLENKVGLLLNFNKMRDNERGIYLIGWELMRTGLLFGDTVDLIIADETHKMANYGRSLQSDRIREIHSEYKLALSGTPAGNRPEGIFSTINWLWEKRYKSYHRWIDDFWRTRRNGAVIDLIRELVPGGVFADLPYVTRRLRKDHRDDMPDVMPERVIEVELTPAQRKIYNQFDKLALSWVDDEETGESDFVATSVALVEDLRLGQVCLGVPTIIDGEVSFKDNAKSSKIAALLEVIEDEVGEEALLVYTHSAKFVPVVVAQLRKKGIRAEAFMGSTIQDERDRLIDELGTTYQVLVAGIAAIGTGTDGLQYKCHNMFWLSKHADWTLNQQAGWRLDRPGQTEPVNVWYTAAIDTVDMDKIDRQEEIGENLNAMIDYNN